MTLYKAFILATLGVDGPTEEESSILSFLVGGRIFKGRESLRYIQTPRRALSKSADRGYAKGVTGPLAHSSSAMLALYLGDSPVVDDLVDYLEWLGSGQAASP
jgi:hypothetical protein